MTTETTKKKNISISGLRTSPCSFLGKEEIKSGELVKKTETQKKDKRKRIRRENE